MKPVSLHFLKSLRTLPSTNCYCAPCFISQPAARCRGTAQREDQLIPPLSLSPSTESSPPWSSLQALPLLFGGCQTWKLPSSMGTEGSLQCLGWLHGGCACPPAAKAATLGGHGAFCKPWGASHTCTQGPGHFRYMYMSARPPSLPLKHLSCLVLVAQNPHPERGKKSISPPFCSPTPAYSFSGYHTCLAC